MHTLDPTIETFYKSILTYAGLEYDSEKNFVINSNPKFGDFTVNGKKVTLPYEANLKHPNGRSIFHPLNENFLSPESPLFLLYKKRLVCELNTKLACLIISLINVANSTDLQNKLTNSRVISLVSGIKHSDMTLIENFMLALSKSKTKNEEAFLFDIFLKKNGSIKDVPFAATGKILFNMPKEIDKSLKAETKDNHVFGAKLRINDLQSLDVIFKSLFGDEKTQAEFIEGTDNKVFRYLNILLTTSYMVTNIINDIALALKEIDDGTLGISEAIVSVDWLEHLPEIYKKTDQIRRIPNQDEMTVTSIAPVSVKHAGVNESAVSNAETFHQTQQQQRPVLQQQPAYQQPQQPSYQQPPAQVYQPQVSSEKEMSVDDFFRAKAAMQNSQYQQPMPVAQPNYYQQPAFQQQPDPRYMDPRFQAPPLPSWMRAEALAQARPMNPAYIDPMQQYSAPVYGTPGYYYGS